MLDTTTSAAPDIASTLQERGGRYGRFADQAAIEQALLDVARAQEGWPRLDPDMKSAIEMMMVKVARILNGDPAYVDNWHDIAGYATLLVKRLSASKGPSDGPQCLEYLFSAEILDLSVRRSIGEMIALELAGASDGEVRKSLGALGLKVLFNGDEAFALAVAIHHPKLQGLFQDSKWSGGCWSQSLSKLDGACPGKVRFEGPVSACTTVPVRSIAHALPGEAATKFGG